eukprot:TRINITY_DN52228_c0_g1_i1.p1 TRINITY_DN52228_c0_g1~~TRINITY_DN52228_c0_g1_i1.p1  ORF type:complete len:213 (+),score=41.34 TRINITY_DN52228_c0_g1_i1:70-708(+)
MGALSNLWLAFCFGLSIFMLMGGGRQVRREIRRLSRQLYSVDSEPPRNPPPKGEAVPDVLFTPAELEERALAVSLGGVVYDVSPSEHLYSGKGWYRYFAGKDATLVFGCGERGDAGFDPNLPEGRGPSDTSSATPEQLLGICNYERHFKRRYYALGRVAPSAFFTAEGTPTKAKASLEAECGRVKDSIVHATMSLCMTLSMQHRAKGKKGKQ